MTQRRSTTKGFTLFEMIVVFVITGLMSAVVMQGFSIVLASRLSVSNAIENLRQVVLGQNIPIDPLRGLLPDYNNNPNKFRGQARTLTGQTMRPLLSPPGAPTPFTMTMEYEAGTNLTTLMYQETGRPKTALAQWPGNGQSFKYRDLTGPWESVWPPPASTSQTPWMVWIDIGPTFAPLVAAVGGSHDRVTRLEDMPMFGTTPSPFRK